MKSLNNYINESLCDNIFEGFLDKLKKAINSVVDSPQKYIDNIKAQIEDLKKEKYWKYKTKEDIDGVAEELDKLNNDEDLRKIYEYVKQIYKGDNLDLKYAVLGDSGCWPLIFKDVEKNFNSNENKTFAIVQIANAIALATKNKFNSKSSSENNHKKSNYHSNRSSKSRRAGILAGAIAASAAMRR